MTNKLYINTLRVLLLSYITYTTAATPTRSIQIQCGNGDLSLLQHTSSDFPVHTATNVSKKRKVHDDATIAKKKCKLMQEHPIDLSLCLNFNYDSDDTQSEISEHNNLIKDKKKRFSKHIKKSKDIQGRRIKNAFHTTCNTKKVNNVFCEANSKSNVELYTPISLHSDFEHGNKNSIEQEINSINIQPFEIINITKNRIEQHNDFDSLFLHNEKKLHTLKPNKKLYTTTPKDGSSITEEVGCSLLLTKNDASTNIQHALDHQTTDNSIISQSFTQVQSKNNSKSDDKNIAIHNANNNFSFCSFFTRVNQFLNKCPSPHNWPKNINKYYQGFQKFNEGSKKVAIELELERKLNFIVFSERKHEIVNVLYPTYRNPKTFKLHRIKKNKMPQTTASLSEEAQEEIMIVTIMALNIILKKIKLSEINEEIFKLYKDTLHLLFFIPEEVKLKPFLWELTTYMPELLFYLEHQLTLEVNLDIHFELLQRVVINELFHLIDILNQFIVFHCDQKENGKKLLMVQIQKFRRLLLLRLKENGPESLQYNLYKFANDTYEFSTIYDSMDHTYNFLLFVLTFTLTSDQTSREHFINSLKGDGIYFRTQYEFFKFILSSKQTNSDVLLTLVLIRRYLEKLRNVSMYENPRIVFIRSFKYYSIIVLEKRGMEENQLYLTNSSNILVALFNVLQPLFL